VGLGSSIRSRVNPDSSRGLMTSLIGRR
jgi:hypothetical protein